MKNLDNYYHVSHPVKFMIWLCLTILFGSPAFATIRYVKQGGSGDYTGTSWNNASPDLQAMIDASSAGDEVWVAAGTYKPTTGTDRTISFVMKNGVAIYGGFFGTETQLSQRNWVANVTSLSGDINGDDVVAGSGSTLSITNNGENSYHVIFNNQNGLNSTAKLDGFSIKGGNANGSSPHHTGGGMYNASSSPTVTNCSFSGNSASTTGGGMYNGSSPTVTNCSFSRNSAVSGGGMYNHSSSPTVTNCSFSGNSADYGGGMINGFSSPTVTNSTFSGNSASIIGGGMYNGHSSPTVTNCSFSLNSAEFGGGMLNGLSSSTVTNCSFSGNSAANGGGMFNSSSSLMVSNCIIWGNSSEISNDNSTPIVSHSIIQGGYTPCTNCPGGNGNVDPLFVSSTNLRLQACSPAVDAGNNTGAPATDLDDNTRPFNATGVINVDIGAYEHQTAYNVCTTCLTSGNVVYVKANASGSNNGKSWENAFTDLQSALALADQCSNVTQIWVAAGTYKPTTGTDRSISFVMKNDLAIYGGFNGTETQLSQRNWVANETTLSGDIGTPNSNSDNSYHVIFNNQNGLNSTAKLDGFTIKGGNANGMTSPHHSGGGMYNASSSPTVINCSFSGNSADYGGGMYIFSSSPTVTNCYFSENSADYGGGMLIRIASSPTVNNCTFSGNSATFGGGMYSNNASSPTVTNCTFSGNSALLGGGMFNSSSQTVTNCNFTGNSASHGGGVYNDSSSPTVTNCTFSGNLATDRGGGMFNGSSSTPIISNCTFSGNSATTSGGGMFNGSSSSTVKNCILWGNSSEISNYNSTPNVSYSIIQGGYTPCTNCPGGNGNVDPLFVSTVNLRLQACSPAINAGNNAAVPSGITTDLDGNPRFYNGGTVDLGAYEFQAAPTPVVAACQSQTVSLNSSGTATLSASALNNGSTGCGTLTYTVGGQSSLIFSCANKGDNNVTLTVTDSRGATATCTNSITVADNIPPTITCPLAINVNADPGSCSATNVVVAPATALDNCPGLVLSNNAPPTFPVGSTTVTHSASDGTNTVTCHQIVTLMDNQAPTITCPEGFIVNTDPGVCGAVVIYNISTADNCTGETWVQTTGQTSGSTFPVGTTSNSFTVTDASGNTAACSFNVTVNKSGDPGLLWAYTAIGFDEVKMKNNTVQSGGVGVVNAGKKAKLEQATMITAANTFVKAPDLDLNGGSMVTTYYPGQVDAGLIPPFQPNNSNCNNNLNIPDNSAPVTLGLACYGDITVGKNVSVTFSGNATVTVKELKMKEGSKLFFSQNTSVHIDKKMDLDKNATLDRGSHTVWMFAEDDVKIDEGSTVFANIYSQKHLKVEKATAAKPTELTGLFIAEKVDAKEFVIWNWDVAQCPFTPNSNNLVINGSINLTATQAETAAKLTCVTNLGPKARKVVIERSANGIHFEPLYEMGEDELMETVSIGRYLDDSPLPGLNFYRATAELEDGTTAFSDVRKLEYSLTETLNLFPNPANHRIQVYSEKRVGKPGQVRIFNSQGVEVFNQQFDALPEHILTFDLSNFRDGLYLLTLRSEGGRDLTKPFVIAR